MPSPSSVGGRLDGIVMLCADLSAKVGQHDDKIGAIEESVQVIRTQCGNMSGQMTAWQAAQKTMHDENNAKLDELSGVIDLVKGTRATVGMVNFLVKMGLTIGGLWAIVMSHTDLMKAFESLGKLTKLW